MYCYRIFNRDAPDIWPDVRADNTAFLNRVYGRIPDCIAGYPVKRKHVKPDTGYSA
jgi:hypothetical protein